jgi:hypothetical protein
VKDEAVKEDTDTAVDDLLNKFPNLRLQPGKKRIAILPMRKSQAKGPVEPKVEIDDTPQTIENTTITTPTTPTTDSEESKPKDEIKEIVEPKVEIEDTPHSIENTATTNSEESTPKTKEVQAHGKFWEKEIAKKIYGATDEELATIGYTDTNDLPAVYNRLDQCKLSIKTTGKANNVCMADCLRVFDAVKKKDEIYHMTVIHYKQIQDKKKVDSITEINLTNSSELLFGSLQRKQIEELTSLVKSMPKGRELTKEEKAKMKTMRDSLHKSRGYIHLDIKCDSKDQRRLQCSLPKFKEFLKKNPERIVAQGSSAEFRGGSITSEITSGRRLFKKEKKEKDSSVGE